MNVDPAQLIGVDVDDCVAVCEKVLAQPIVACEFPEEGASESGSSTGELSGVRVRCEYEGGCLGRGHAALAVDTP